MELGDPGAAAALDKLLEETEGLERLKVLTACAHTAHWALDAEGATRMSQEAFHLAKSLSAEEFIGPALALQSLASSMAGNMNTALELGGEGPGAVDPRHPSGRTRCASTR